MARAPVYVEVKNTTGDVVAGATATVKIRATGTNATLYTTETGPTTATNPMTTDSAGRATAWVDRGAYNITVSGTGIATFTVPWDSSPGADRAIDDTWLPIGANPTVVTSLPGSPVDGQLIDLVVDTGGTYGGPYIWRCRYRSATTGSKWHVIGGEPYTARVETAQNHPGGTAVWANLTTTGPSVVTPFTGVYRLDWGCRINSATGIDTYAGIQIAGVDPTIGTDPVISSYSTGGTTETTCTMRWTKSLTTGNALTMRYRNSGAAGTPIFAHRWLSVTPIRIG